MREESDTIRAFIALDLPVESKDALGQVIQSLRQTVPQGIRWVNAEGIHLTLKFLGNIDASRVDEIIKAVGCAAKNFGQGPFSLGISDMGIFPGARQPRVLWAGVSGDLDCLRKLQTCVDTAAAGVGFRRETRPFSPHLTLGRVQDTAHGSVRRRIGPALAAAVLPPTAPWRADRIHLIRSTLTREGASYSSLGHVLLQETS